MTKEKIINGVDVAGCVRLWNGQCTGKDNILLGNCIDLDCELKQLKRLEFELKVTKADYEASEQENEKLKQQLEIDKNQINYFIEENKRLSELTCVNCGEKYLSPDGSELYEENERLKHKIETILKRKKDNCTCEDCYNEGLWEGMAIGSYEEVTRLKHTLQEIKEIAERAFAVCDDDCGNANKFQEIIELTKAEEE